MITNLKQQAVQGTIWATTASWARQGLGLLIFLVLARLLGPANYGLVGMATIVVTFTQMAVTEGWSVSLIQQKDPSKTLIDSIFWLLMAIAALLCVLTIAFAGLVADFFAEPDVALLLRGMSPLVILDALSAVPTVLLRREFKFRALALRALVAVVGGGTVGITMALLGFGAWSLVGHLTTQSLISVIILWTSTSWRPGLAVSGRAIREVAGFSMGLIGIRLIGLVEQYLPRAVIGSYLGPTQLGYYNIAWRIIEIFILSLITPVAEVGFSTFAHARDDVVRLTKIFFSITEALMILAFPCFLGLLVLCPEIIVVTLGQKWEPSAIVVQVVVAQVPYLCLTTMTGTILNSLGRNRWQIYQGLLNLSLGTVVLFGLVFWSPQLTIGLIVTALSIKTLSLWPIEFIALRRLAGINVLRDIRVYGRIIGASVAMMVCVLVWKDVLAPLIGPRELVVTAAAIGVLSYLAGCFILDPTIFQRLSGLVRVARSHPAR